MMFLVNSSCKQYLTIRTWQRIIKSRFNANESGFINAILWTGMGARPIHLKS